MRKTAAALALLLLAWVDGAADAGTVSPHAFDSPALGHPMPAMVYVPDGPPPAEGWSVLYLFHGLDGTENDWLGAGGVAETLDRLIADGDIRPLLVVMPAAGNSWYVDSKALGGAGDYETAIVRDLRAAIEAAYPTRRDAGGRFLAGASMGGSGALRLAIGHPDLYSAAAALSPAIWQNVPAKDLDISIDQLDLLAESAYFHIVDPDTVLADTDIPPAGPHFDGAFGTPFQPRRFNAANVFTLVADRIREGGRLPSIYLTVGDDDSHELWRGAFAFFETMKADKRPIEFRVTDGDHSWDLWRRSIGDALIFLAGTGTARQPAR